MKTKILTKQQRMIFNENGEPGLVARCKSKRTGTMIAIFHSEQAGLKDIRTLWAVRCETHGVTVDAKNVAEREEYRSRPDGWCEQCEKITHEIIRNTNC